MAIFGVIDTYVGRISDLGASLWQFHATRSALVLPMILVIAALGFGRLRPQRLWAVALRSVLTAVSMMIYFGSLGIMDVAPALAGLFSAPIWTVIISVLFLKVRVGPLRTVAVLMGFVGILLVVQPDTGDLGLSLIFPMLAGVFYACGALTTRHLCSEEPTLILLAGNFFVLMIIGLAGLGLFAGAGSEGFLSPGWAPLTPELCFWIGLQAVGAMIGVYLLIRAYQIAEATFVAAFEYSVMVFGPAYAWIALGQSLNGFAILGLLAIIAAAVLIQTRGRA